MEHSPDGKLGFLEGVVSPLVGKLRMNSPGLVRWKVLEANNRIRGSGRKTSLNGEDLTPVCGLRQQLEVVGLRERSVQAN